MTLQKKLLFLIALTYCALSALYAIFTPPWEAPDETAHYLYAAGLAEQNRPAQASGIEQTKSFSQDQAYLSSSYEWFQPALGYLPAALAYKVIRQIAPQSLPDKIPGLSALSPEIPRRYNIFLHPEKTLAETWRANWGLLAMRIVSALTGLLVILAAYQLGNLLEGQPGLLGICAAGLIAFLPQFTFINASVRGDTLTSAIAALVFLLAAQLQSAPRLSTRKLILMGLLLGLGLLSKNTFLYMLPVGLLAAILPGFHAPKTWFKAVFLVAAPALLIWASYHLAFVEARAALDYTTNSMLKIRPDYLSWAYLKTIPGPLLIDLFYARFGWANIAPPKILNYAAFSLWSLGAAISLARFIFSAKKSLSQEKSRVLWLLLAGFIFALIGVLRFNLSIYQPQGRFLFPVLLPWAIWGLWGLWQILGQHRQKHAALLLVGGMFLFNVYALGWVIFPAFWR